MASGGDIHSILYKGDIFKKPSPKYDSSRNVIRHFPHAAPDDLSEQSSDSESESTVFDTKVPTPKAEPLKDRRLELLKQLDREAAQPETQVGRRGRRRIVEPTVIVYNESAPSVEVPSTLPLEVPESFASSSQPVDPESSVSAPSSDAPPERKVELDRAERRARILRLRKQEEEATQVVLAEPSVPAPESSTSDDGEASEESDFEEARPIFIPKSKRSLEQKSQQEEELEASKAEEERKVSEEERIQESKALLTQVLLAEQEEERRRKEVHYLDGYEVDDLPDDNDDNEDPVLQYNLWRTRELKRMVRDLEEERKFEIEKEQIEKRRQMTPEELERDNARLDALMPQTKSKTKYAFLQKYYHKGAFFQDLATSGQEPLYLRDFNQPTPGDKVDKASLPTPLQVRRGLFGKAGQVKHTHLTAVDTTDFTSNWAQKNNPIFDRIQSKLGGYKGANEIERPSKKKRS